MQRRSSGRGASFARRTSACVALAGVVACGARTDLGVGRADGRAVDSGSNSSGTDDPAKKQCATHEEWVPVDKVDLLFSIDNSASMADKQSILAEAVPRLVDRLVNPGCVDARGNVQPAQTPCPQGTTREFDPVRDIRIAVVSSSLGGHGADLCSPSSNQWNAEQDDHARLIPTVRQIAGLETYRHLGFLAWDPSDSSAISNSEELRSDFTRVELSVGENGCGFESQLESWYRFLIDPDPPASVTQSNGQAVVDYPDGIVLEQRRAFLRPDSLLVIAMITDENDCSIVDDGVGWIIASSAVGTRQFRMPAATSTCASDPNSPCCRSCGIKETNVPSGCVPIADDAICQSASSLSAEGDPLNLRCWQHKRRFGIDLLQPTGRYVDGLSQPTVKNRAGQEVPNPIFSDLNGNGTVPRGPEMVFLAGIVGVPWQDIARDPSLSGPGLRYFTARELTEQRRWDVILGDSAARPVVRPSDPFMRESDRPRAGENPIIGDPIAPASSLDPQQSVINGHEYFPSVTAGDLQYACIFPLATPVVCAIDDVNCDCTPDSDGGVTALSAGNRPVCQPPGGGLPSTTQYWAKAYPGLRELQVLKDFGNNSIVASICPKIFDPADPDYGYNPAIWGIVDGLKTALVGRCVPVGE